MEKQPAKINYFFGPGWDALKETIVNAFVLLADIEVATFKSFLVIWSGFISHISFGGLITSIIRTVAFIIKAVITSVLSAVIITLCTLVHVVVVLVFMGFIYVAFSIVWFLDFVYRKLHGIISHCSNCQQRVSLPYYRCACGKIHTKLIPSKYGILERECNCGRKLPVTFLNGRQKLDAICPHCNASLADGGAHIAITFPLIGGPSSGKTCFVNMAIYSLSQHAQKLNYEFAYEDEGTMEYENNIQGIQNGEFPAKTNDMALVFYRFTWGRQGQKIKNEVSLCDIGGEAYADKATLQQQIGYSNSQGYIVIVDPLSIEEYRKELEKKIDLSSYNGSTMSLDEILDMLISTVDNLSGNDSKEKITKDCAIVFTKLDLPGLDELIGDKGNEEYCLGHKASFLEAQNAITENFLRTYGEDNFLNTVKAKFKNIQFFACTALADSGSGKLYSKNAARALAWVMNNKGRNIKFCEQDYISLID